MMMVNLVIPGPRGALTRRTIAGKSVVTLRSHHYALLSWQEWQQELNLPPRLLSIDFHTDTNDAFNAYACDARGTSLGPHPFWEQDRTARLSQLSADDAASVDAAVNDLRHDEHIDAAIRSGILDVAFILAHSTDEMLPNHGNAIPQDRIVLLGDDTPRGDEFCYRRFRDQILGAEFLKRRLSRADEICRTAELADLLATPFILDIDLDSFNTRQAIAPRDPSVFYDLIRAAYAITIAQEPDCVSSCQLEGEDLSAPWLELQLLAHFDQALL